MKKIVSLILVISVLLICLSSCVNAEVMPLTCEELIAAYEEAGYHTFHSEPADDGYEWNCYLKVWLDDEYDYAFFYFFDTEEVAEARAAERKYNILIYLFTVIYGDPTWLYTETYGCIEYEYSNSALIRPFQNLIKQKR